MGPSLAILGTGSYAPAKVVSNHGLSKLVDTSDEWITTRTGIRERRIAGHPEPSTDLATRAAIAAIADARLTSGDIDLVVPRHGHTGHADAVRGLRRAAQARHSRA